VDDSGRSPVASGAAGATPSPASTTPAPASTSSTYDTYANLSYVPNGTSQQTLNLYLPRDRDTGRPVPLIIYIHGGGWSGGDASELQANSGWQTYLSDGFALASINYTLSGTATFPQQIYDVKAAIRYLRAKAGQYHLDGQVGLWGESAGCQLAALAGATCGVLPLEGSEGVTRESSCVQAAVDGMAGDRWPTEELYGLPVLLAGREACPPASTAQWTRGVKYLTLTS
jgi:acetyl esterase/lipase